MPKERNFNPVQAQRKADKAKAIKKGKAEVASRRNERLAKRNPEQIRKQIEDLKAITSGGGKLTSHEEQILEGLEKEFKAVNKAREALGDNAPTFRRGPPRDGDRGVLGKRRRDAEDASSSDSDVAEDVKSIPMPRDTPPPIPKEILDEWYAKRRAKRNANLEPLGGDRGHDRGHQDEKEFKKPSPTVETKTVYEAKPMVRDLRKEATSAFVPTAVKMKLDKGKGHGGLIEPEEADRLEQEGYMRTGGAAGQSGSLDTEAATTTGLRHVTLEEVEDDDD